MMELLLGNGVAPRIISVALFHDGLHLREIARRAGVAPPEAMRELNRLVRLGLLRKESKGRLSIFHIQQECPYLSEVRNLYMKTDGVAALLRNKLSRIPGVELAFIFGSMAKGDFTERSDVDVMVVGEAGRDTVLNAIVDTEKHVGREINFIHWSTKDWKTKRTEKGAFITSLLKNPRIPVLGDQNEFERAFGKALVRAS